MFYMSVCVRACVCHVMSTTTTVTIATILVRQMLLLTTSQALQTHWSQLWLNWRTLNRKESAIFYTTFIHMNVFRSWNRMRRRENLFFSLYLALFPLRNVIDSTTSSSLATSVNRGVQLWGVDWGCYLVQDSRLFWETDSMSREMVSRQVSFKSKNKMDLGTDSMDDMEGMVSLKGEDSLKCGGWGARVTEIALYRILPSKARFS